jgi:protein-disulfide isomerase
MHDSIMQSKHLLDTNEFLSIAKNLNMNLKQFKIDLNKPETAQEIEYKSKLIMHYGIYATPTILINGKPVFDSSSETEIDRIIQNKIN